MEPGKRLLGKVAIVTAAPQASAPQRRGCSPSTARQSC